MARFSLTALVTAIATFLIFFITAYSSIFKVGFLQNASNEPLNELTHELSELQDEIGDVDSTIERLSGKQHSNVQRTDFKKVINQLKSNLLLKTKQIVNLREKLEHVGNISSSLSYSSLSVSHNRQKFKEDEKYQKQFQNFLKMSKNEPGGQEPVVILDWFSKRLESMERIKQRVGHTGHITHYDIVDNLGKNFKGDHYIAKSSENCGGCWFTNDRNFEKSASGIIVDNTHLPLVYLDMPRNSERSDKQYWIFWSREPAARNYQINVEKLNEVHENGVLDEAYNFTTSYRRDSDVPYHFTVNDFLLHARHTIDPTAHLSDEEYMGKLIKNKFSSREKNVDAPHIAWIVSNCNHTKAARTSMDTAIQLKNLGLKYDAYGRCFENGQYLYPTNKNGKRIKYKKISETTNAYHDEEISLIKTWSNVKRKLSMYKFYFSFENAIHCKDYLSEKFWKQALDAQLVPIVSGVSREDISVLAPPNSYIHVEDYPDLKDLVKHIEYLNGNDTAYLEYHKWRLMTADLSKPFTNYNDKRNCGVCRLIMEKKAQGFPKHSVKSVSDWWFHWLG